MFIEREREREIELILSNSTHEGGREGKGREGQVVKERHERWGMDRKRLV